MHDLTNGNKALLNIDNDEINVEQFGIKENNVAFDNQDKINSCFEYAYENKINNIIFPRGKIYYIRGYESDQPDSSLQLFNISGIKPKSNQVINFNNSTIRIIPNSRVIYAGISFHNVNNVKIKNAIVYGDLEEHTGTTGEWGYGIAFGKKSTNVYIENCVSKYCWGDGINIISTYGESNENIFIRDCICDNNRRQGMSVENVINLYCYNCKFINTGRIKSTAPSAGVDIEPLGDSDNPMYTKNCIFDNCLFDNNVGTGFSCMGYGCMDTTLKNCTIINNDGAGGAGANCYFLSTRGTFKLLNSYIERGLQSQLTIFNNGNSIIEGNHFLNCCFNIYEKESNSNISFKNNIFELINHNLSYNGFIEIVHNNQSTLASLFSNNKIYIYNNYFYCKDNDHRVRAHLIGSQKDNFSWDIEHNTFINGYGGIVLTKSSIIKDNHFINNTNECLTFRIPAVIENEFAIKDLTHTIKNNIFEHVNSISYSGIFFMSDNHFIFNIINNIAYSGYLNEDLRMDEHDPRTTYFINHSSQYYNTNNIDIGNIVIDNLHYNDSSI